MQAPIKTANNMKVGIVLNFISSLHPTGGSIECCISFSVFAKLRVFDQRQGDRLAIQFRVYRSHAGRAIERSQGSQNHCQRLAQIRQPPGASPLDLDCGGEFDASQQIQVQ